MYKVDSFIFTAKRLPVQLIPLTFPSVHNGGCLLFHMIGMYTLFSPIFSTIHCNSLPPQDNFLISPDILSEIICKNGSSEFYPNSTLKAVYWFVSVLFLVD